eukprot:4817420-Prorocentrum_lima.AAC.1
MLPRERTQTSGWLTEGGPPLGGGPGTPKQPVLPSPVVNGKFGQVAMCQEGPLSPATASSTMGQPGPHYCSLLCR